MAIDQATLAKAIQLQQQLEARLEFLQNKELSEKNLSEFVKFAWRWIDGADYMTCWAIDAVCEHLEAVTRGYIKRLLINIPPRCAKSNVASIAWPAWTWCQSEISLSSGPQVKFLCSSYSHNLGLNLATKSRRLVDSPWYQERWALKFRTDQNTKSAFENEMNGARQATSVGGSLLGIGGDIVMVDDPHDTEKVESDIQRQTALNHFSELITTRLNNPKKSPVVVIMQRLHQNDVSGYILNGDDADDWTHLMLPMHYDKNRHCHTVIGAEIFDDPRTVQNEIMWPERFTEEFLNKTERTIGPYMYSGRYEQIPTPSGGGIIQEAWWQEWPAAMFPLCENIICSVDPAYTEKHEIKNDPTGISIWGVFRDGNGNPKVVLLYAYQCKMALHDLVVTLNALCTNHKMNDDALNSVQSKMNDSRTDRSAEVTYVPRFPVNRIVVELKASGHSVVQELGRLFRDGNFVVEGFKPDRYGDKVARVHSVVPLFTDEMVYAPVVRDSGGTTQWRSYADMLIEQVNLFPFGEHDDLVDSMSQALIYLRTSGALIMREEYASDVYDELLLKEPLRPLYGNL